MARQYLLNDTFLEKYKDKIVFVETRTFLVDGEKYYSDSRFFLSLELLYKSIEIELKHHLNENKKLYVFETWAQADVDKEKMKVTNLFWISYRFI